jgi:hypothetical protein
MFEKQFFVFLFSKLIQWISSSKIEIKFSIDNVPSLFRCEQNGSLLYFNHFPTDDEFQQSLKNNQMSCNFLLTSIDQRTSIELDKLELLCESVDGKDHVNNFLFFSTKCSTDSCRKFVEFSARMIIEYRKGDINIERISFITNRDYANQIVIGELANKKNFVKNGQIRTNQIVFEYQTENYFNMMCE